MHPRHILHCLFLFIAFVGAQDKRPLIIAHRGSSGVLPEHTVAAFERAVEDGADAIECDVSITKDLHLVCRHESRLDETTDVASRPEFADKKTTRVVDGTEVTSWYTVDFTLEELKTLRAVQRYSFRDPSYNGLYPIATLEEFIQVAKDADRHIDIILEVKDPVDVNNLDIFPDGTRFEDILLQELTRYGYTDENDGCYLQSFDEESMIYIKQTLKTKLPCAMGLWIDVDDSTLDRWASLGFHGVGCWKDQVYRHYMNGSYKNKIYATTNFVEKCQERGPKVSVYSFRNEDMFLSWDDGQDPYAEYERFMAKSIDAFITDFPATAKRYLDSKFGNCERESWHCKRCGGTCRFLSLSPSPNDREWFKITPEPHRNGQDIDRMVHGNGWRLFNEKPYLGERNMNQIVTIEASGGEEFAVMLLRVKTLNVKKIDIRYYNGNTLVGDNQKVIPKASVREWAITSTKYTRNKVTKIVLDFQLREDARIRAHEVITIRGLTMYACQED